MDEAIRQLAPAGILVVLVLGQVRGILKDRKNGANGHALRDWQDSPRAHTDLLTKIRDNGDSQLTALCRIEKAIVNGNGKKGGAI